MLTEERYRKIQEYLENHELATVPALMELLKTSESTLRRDLMSLEAQGLCQRVRGGVKAIQESSPRSDSRLDRRRGEHQEEKQQIGQAAASLIEPGETIYIDAGSTTEALIDALEEADIRVVTNSINHAALLARKGIPVTLVGGEFKSITDALVGEEALEFLDRYTFSKGFFGTNAISGQGDLQTPDVREAMVKSKAMKHSRQRFILADSSKFKAAAAIRFGSMDHAALVCEADADIPLDCQAVFCAAKNKEKD